ncbi:MAG: thioredoxin domain-containing protein [Bacteroidetes bacterium]|nr:thioredoxin domain-containing protein [Bacteroidota bacterium]
MQNDTSHQYTNALINETSPYLLQHAHNPVNWYAWNSETLEKAKKEDKLLLISIGYSACHWCHVMEHESFENEEVAKIMNQHFICIKVDREERPDIDQIYMNAVQLMNGQGGWPLNCFALPNGKPFYGGTYFQTNQWKHILQAIAGEYEANPQKVIEYADELTKGIKESELLPKITHHNPFTMDVLEVAVQRFKTQFDYTEGGANRAPKFPLPNNYEFLLDYYYHTNDKTILQFVDLTLTKMAFGGIYDQIGGGFARYSTDSYWKVPHFEKMLYDNAQLVLLYSKAYQLTKNKLYKHVVYQTLEFIEREMTTENGAFYSALDADSEGEEGKFYVWTKNELQTLLAADYPLIEDYYNINKHGEWEENYILLRKDDDEIIAKNFHLTPKELEQKIENINKILLEARSKKIRPGLDDKTLTSWNALMLKGYVDAYNTFGEKEFLTSAIKNATFITEIQLRKDGGLNHNYKNGTSNLDGYLEDYCFTIEAFIALYEATFDEKWLEFAKQLMDYTIVHFYDEKTGFFFFTSDEAKGLIARKMELSDNVIPASNSSIAKGLFLLGLYFEKDDYTKKATQMLKNIEAQIPKYVSGYSNWASLLLNQIKPLYEIVITGGDAHEKRNEFYQTYLPNKIIIGSIKKSNLPLLHEKQTNRKTMIYVCYNKTCQKPVETVGEALKQIK